MRETISILLAAQDDAVSHALREQCSQFGLSVSHADDPDELGKTLESGDFDAIILAEGFCPGGMSGDDVLADCMAATNYSNGVLLLGGAQSASEARIPGVRALARPLRLGRFLIALAEILDSKDDTDHGGPRRIGPYMLYPSEKVLRRREEKTADDIRLTDKEVQILVYLHERAGQAVAREDLLQDVWQYSGAVMTRTLETHVYRLRQKIEDDPSSATLLRTESGGYSLSAGNGR